MSFSSTLQADEGMATITLVGELDAAAAPVFKADIEKAAGLKPKRLVLMMGDLNYMASAGLRVLIFAKQKLGAESDIYVIGTQDSVIETLRLTGFYDSVIVQETYQAL